MVLTVWCESWPGESTKMSASALLTIAVGTADNRRPAIAPLSLVGYLTPHVPESRSEIGPERREP